MYDILIKGMSMPVENAVLTLHIHPDGRIDWQSEHPHVVVDMGKRAIQLPPYGRLVDADKFDIKYINFHRNNDGTEYTTLDMPSIVESGNNRLYKGNQRKIEEISPDWCTDTPTEEGNYLAIYEYELKGYSHRGQGVLEFKNGEWEGWIKGLVTLRIVAWWRQKITPYEDVEATK